MSDERVMLRGLADTGLSKEDTKQLRARHALRWCACVEDAMCVTVDQLRAYLDRHKSQNRQLDHTPPDISGVEHWIYDIGDEVYRPGTKNPGPQDRVNLCISRFRHSPRATSENVMSAIYRIAMRDQIAPADLVEMILDGAA